MKYILQIFGTILYGTLSSYLVWLFLSWVTPYVMSASWLMLVGFVFLAGGLFELVVGSLATLLAVPNLFLMKHNKVAKAIYTVICLFWGYCSVALPFHIDMHFGVKGWILALTISFTALTVFMGLITAAWETD